MEDYLPMYELWIKFALYSVVKRYPMKDHFVVITKLTIDLMWSDPEDIETWAVSPRGAGWLFGRKVTLEVLCD
jgi:diadenosine tetraphosphatase ApaH/serine/threonine PP2A family protein phosphatase